MIIGNVLGFGDCPRRNVEVRIGKRELFSEISEPRGTIKSADVVGIRVTEGLDAGKHIIRLFLDTTSQGKVLFYTANTRLDIALLLDELEACIGKRPGTWDKLEIPADLGARAPDSAAAASGQVRPRLSDRAEQKWKRIEDSKTDYQLTGESVVRAVSIPAPPSSKKATLIRVTHSNPEGRVDSDLFVRIGNPKKPLRWNAFDTVSDWVRLPVVEDLIESATGQWVSRGKKTGEGVPWSGTYEAEMRFPKGQHLIEIKLISRVPQVCSIVLSNWKVNVR